MDGKEKKRYIERNLPNNLTDEEALTLLNIIEVAKKRETIEKQNEAKERAEKHRQEKLNLMNNLADMYGVKDNPKLQQCFDLAWSYRYYAGEREVRMEFAKFVELIK
jgi:hypothetical protein